MEALARLQLRRPVAILAAVLVSVAFAGVLASRLTLRTGVTELLPENKQSVRTAHDVAARLAAASTLVVVARGKDKLALERFVDALAPELRALPPGYVGSVDDGIRAARAYVESHALYAPLADVEAAHARIVERYDYEVGRAMGTLLDESEPPPPITLESLRGDEARAELDELERRFPDGYYLEPGGELIAVVVRTDVPVGDVARSHELCDLVRAAIARVDPERFEAGMQVDLAGDFIEALEENEQVAADLGEVGVAGVLLILGLVFCFFLRVRPLLLLALTIAAGVSWTFGLAALRIGHLNASTGFLVSIVAGNGINFGIIYLARYLEARREHDVGESLRIAHTATWLPTLAAAGAAMVAYGSLLATSCRAFRQFGEIGGCGMVLSWLATYLVLPSLLVVSERLVPLARSPRRFSYGRPFALLALRHPRAIVAAGAVATIASLVVAVRYVAADPMEYDLANTRTVAGTSAARALELRAAAVVGRGAWDGVAILVDRPEQAPLLETALLAEHGDAIGEVVTLFDFVPSDQDDKLELFADARRLVERARAKRFIDDAAWRELEPHLAKLDTRAIGLHDLPDAIAATFTEKDGTRGRVVYVVPAEGRTLNDARYLMAWADALRETRLADDSVVHGSGRSIIFADLVLVVIEDTPRSIFLSLVLTSLVVLIAFRARREAWLALGALLVGFAWMLGCVALSGMKLNFLNVVALPITLGIGADYAVNVVQRANGAATRAELATAITETGGAVILCSLTTTVGYLALTLSSSRAIRGFGIAAAAGEVACVLAAVLVLPAFLALRSRGAAQPGGLSSSGRSMPTTL
jgi:predicted RND superfamily exporter protein